MFSGGVELVNDTSLGGDDADRVAVSGGRIAQGSPKGSTAQNYNVLTLLGLIYCPRMHS